LVPHLPLTKAWKGILATTISIGVTAIFCSMDLDRIRSMFDWRKLGPIDLVHTLAAAAVLFLLLNVYFAFTASIGVSTGGAVAELSGASFLAEILLVGLIAPVTEEFAFRGFILGRLEKVLRPSEAMVVQAALFSVLHLLPWSFPSHFLMGLAFGYLARVTGSPSAGLFTSWAIGRRLDQSIFLKAAIASPLPCWAAARYQRSALARSCGTPRPSA
jgi:membrane protease YdiL (CAAX protease family)